MESEHSRHPKVTQEFIDRVIEAFPKKPPKGKTAADVEQVLKDLKRAGRALSKAPENEPLLPRDRMTSLIQAEMDRIAATRIEEAPGPAPLTADFFFSNGDPGWVSVAVAVIQRALAGTAGFVAHKSPGDFRFDLPAKCSVALFADWGTGRPAAEAVAAQMGRLNPDFLIHLGDIYYAGQEDEVHSRFLEKLPKPAALKRSFALNGNHEMYSGGRGYFDVILPALGQPASYFSLGNENWQLLGLDTSYQDARLKDPQLEWLKAQLDRSRRNILLTHHQGFSVFEDFSDKLMGQLSPLIATGKIHAWFWGHEHLHIVYQKQRGVACRCIGHGAIPYMPPGRDAASFLHPEFKVQFVNRRLRQDTMQGVNGFALLEIDGPRLHVRYVDEDGLEQFTEDLHFVIDNQ